MRKPLLAALIAAVLSGSAEAADAPARRRRGATAAAGGAAHEHAHKNVIEAPAQHDEKGAAPALGTQDQIAKELLLASLAKQAMQAAAEPENRRFKDVIMDTHARMARAMRIDPFEAYDANQAEVFAPMLKLQMAQQKEMWQLRKARREGALEPGDYERRLKDIEARVNAGMAQIPPGIVMNVFHSEFNRAWQEARSRWRQPDAPESGLPTSGHIGGMVEANPRDPRTLALSAQEKLAAGDRAGALTDLNRSIANGGSADAYAMRGAMRLEDQEYDGARQDAKKALELDPGDPNAIAVLKFSEGRASPGSDPSTAAGADSGGGFAPAAGRLLSGMTDVSLAASTQKLDEARRAMKMADFEAAVALARRALELNPGNAAAHGFLSSIFAQRKDYLRAIESAEAGLALAPRAAGLLNAKAFAENRLKRYRDALASAGGAIEAGARDPLSYANRAHAYGGLGDKDAMMADINRAAALDPRYRDAAAAAAALQLPTSEDLLFLFPGETGGEAASGAAPRRGKRFGLVVGAGVAGGLLLALGLLSIVLAPLKDSVVSAFTKLTRAGPSVGVLEARATPPAAFSGLIRGQYQIARKIGEGGMGMVYEGTDRSLGRRVAIKKMRDELRLNPRERDRFIIEAKTVASLRHANIVDIYAIAEEGEDVYLVFEYVEGRTIHDLVQTKGRLSPADALRVTAAMGEALAYAHSRGVIHRDMKPSNVMLDAEGRVKVMDFGIARMAKDALTRYSMTNNVVGTPPYMAPEQEQGVVRKESDVYSLAICAYEMLTGKLPFIGIAAGMLMNKINMSYIPPSRAIAGLPQTLDEVFLKAFQADPDKRYRTPLEFVAALAAAVDGSRSNAA